MQRVVPARHGIRRRGIFLFAPYPGSKLYERLRAQGTIPDMTDEYCASLMKRATVDGGISYCERISNLELTVYQMGEGLAAVPDDLIEDVVESAEAWPGECIMIEMD